MTVKECVACEKSRPLWYAGIIGVAIITLSVLFIFEIIELESQIHWITFSAVYGMGFVIVGVLIAVGIIIVKQFCDHKDDGGDDTNFDNVLRLAGMLGCFCLSAIVLSLIAFHIDNTYWETVSIYEEVSCADAPDDYRLDCISKQIQENSDGDFKWVIVQPEKELPENETIITGIELDDNKIEWLLDDQYEADKANCSKAKTWFGVHSGIYEDTRPEYEQTKEYRALASAIWHDRMEEVC